MTETGPEQSNEKFPHVAVWVFTILCVIPLVVAIYLTAGSPSVTRSEVVYEVTGNCRHADIRIINEAGSPVEFAHVSVPWRRTYAMVPGDSISLSASAEDTAAELTGTIRVNGAPFAVATHRAMVRLGRKL